MKKMRLNGFSAVLGGLLLPMFTSTAFAYTIYVSNEKDNTISIIDGETLEKSILSNIQQTIEQILIPISW